MTLGELLKAASFHTNKALGQNFLSDENLLSAIVSDSGVTADDVVVEIGTGAGTLTRALAKAAKKVYSFEVDANLKPVLDISLQGVANVEVIFRDVLKMSDEDLTAIVGKQFKVVANLPYYVTTPMVLRFIESDLDVSSLTVMVQDEVARRFSAEPNTESYSAITLAIAMWGDAEITRTVSRNMFFPAPNVDSAVVRVTRVDDRLQGEDKALVKKLARSAFAMRRKTLCNNLAAAMGISKSDAAAKIVACGLSEMVRGEVLSLDDFVALSHQFKD